MKNALVVLTILAALLLPQANAKSQILNRLGVEDDIFEIYAKCRIQPFDTANLAIADSLYRIGVERNDYKIKTLALNVSYSVQYVLEDWDSMDRSIQEIKDIQSNHPDINDIYFVALYQYTQYLLAGGRENEAILEAREMVRKAIGIGDPYGLMLSYRAIAFIYDVRKNFPMAAECYQKAADYCRQADADVELPSINSLLAQELIELKQYDRARAILEEVEKNKDITDLLRAQVYYISACLGIQSKDHVYFWKYYEILEKMDNLDYILDDDARYYLSAYYNITKNNFGKALEYASLIETEKTRISCLAEVYTAMGEFEQSTKALSRYVEIQDSLNVIVQNEDLAMLDAEMNNYQIRSYANRVKHQIQILLSLSIVAILAVAMTFLAMTLLRNKKHQRKLEKKNLELSEAKDIAMKALETSKAANEIKTRFLQNMSHEIRTPLNAVVGFSQLMALPDGFVTDEEKATYGKIITNNTQMLTMLIDDILSLADVENGNYRINKNQFRCNDVGQFAIRTVESRVPSGVVLSYSSDLDDTFVAYTDERRVQQVLINFLTNACKHTEKGTIHLHLYRSDDPQRLCFSVTDTGTGVPAEMADAIFDRFVKLDSYKQGAGIGLNICKIIAKNLGGDVYLDKTYTQGARFVFTFLYDL